MSKRNRKRRGRSTSPFVMLHWHYLDSQGWHELSPYARLAYIELMRLYNGTNNGSISLSARRLALQMPCNKATAARALRELDDAGFIETVKLGSFTRKNRLASEYRLTNFPCDVTGEAPNRKWNQHRWQPSDGTSARVLKPDTQGQKPPRRYAQLHPSSAKPFRQWYAPLVHI